MSCSEQGPEVAPLVADLIALGQGRGALPGGGHMDISKASPVLEGVYIESSFGVLSLCKNSLSVRMYITNFSFL